MTHFPWRAERWRDLPLPALAVTVLALVYVALVLYGAGGDPLAFVNYDGYFSYYLARAPAAAAPLLDVPAYRYQRILYPLVARLFAGGVEQWIPWSLIAVNVAAIGLGTWATSRLLLALGVSRWYALAYGLHGANFVALRTDLNEPLAQMLVQMALLASVRERRWLTVLFFSLAALAKETTLIFLGAWVLYHLWRRQWRQAALLSAAALPFFFYQLFLWLWLGTPGLGSGGAGATPFTLVPLGGWLQIAEAGLLVFAVLSTVLVPLVVLPALAGLWLSTRALLRRQRHPLILALLLHSVVILFLPHSSMREPAAMVRLIQGLAISLLLFGALVRSNRLLNYSFLWIFTNVLLVHGTA